MSQILDYFPLKSLQLMFFSATISLPIKRMLGALAGKFESFILSNATSVL